MNSVIKFTLVGYLFWTYGGGLCLTFSWLRICCYPTCCEYVIGFFLAHAVYLGVLCLWKHQGFDYILSLKLYWRLGRSVLYDLLEMDWKFYGIRTLPYKIVSVYIHIYISFLINYGIYISHTYMYMVAISS